MSVTRLRLLALAAVLVTPAFAAEKADVEAGKSAFTSKCGICHATSKEPGGPIMGPNLAGLIGRKAAGEKEFTMYTPALTAFGEKQKWNARTLDEFLKAPFEAVPGTTMPMPLPDDKERADVIAYLSTLK
jgi:cytochrome c2